MRRIPSEEMSPQCCRRCRLLTFSFEKNLKEKKTLVTSDLLSKKQLQSSATAATFNLKPPFSLRLSSQNAVLHVDAAPAQRPAYQPVRASVLLVVCLQQLISTDRPTMKRTAASIQLSATEPSDQVPLGSN